MNSPNRRIRAAWKDKKIRWGVAAGLLVIVPIYIVVLRSWLIDITWGIWFFVDLLLWVTVGVSAYWYLDRLDKLSEENNDLADKLAQAQVQASEAAKRQQMVFQISQLYNQANDEDDIIQLTLRLSREAVSARGASYVPLDDRSHPLKPLTTGELPAHLTEDWLQYLASPAVRHRCSSCQSLGHATAECSLLDTPVRAVGMFCLPFVRGEREFGMLNLYLPGTDHISPDTQEFLKKIVDEATLALEGIRLRKRELATLHELQSARERTDLEALITNLLLKLNETLEADCSQLSVLDGGPGERWLELQSGELPDSARSLVDGILQTVMTSRQPVLVGDVSGHLDGSPGIRALMAAPLVCSDESVMGAIVVTSRRVKAFNQRQLSMLQTVASQTALVVQNVNLIAELEYKTMMEERTRLAREIHDGLAQILGFLKLKIAQMKNYAEQGEYDRLVETIPVCYDTLTEAYQEVRQAIDGLRIQSNADGVEGWLRQAAIEFQVNSGLQVQVIEPVGNVNLPPEVHAQLIRILLEALNNVRKHARGGQIWISCQEIDGELIIEVRDDGIGFDIEDIPGPSRYGLKGMRERAELIGADFQIISRPMEGTTVRLRLPNTVIGVQM